MSDFNEFDEQGSVPNRDTGSIISHAFEMYKGVILYAVVAAIIYYIGDFFLQSISGFHYWSDFRDYEDFDGDYSQINYFNRPGTSLYFSGYGLLGIFLSPLFVGLIYITNKFNTKIAIEFSDLFIGYRQNLGNILLYSLITNIILWISVIMCIVPVFFVFPLFFIGYPILLFENATAMDAISKTYNIAKENYGVFLGSAVLGVLISVAGVVLCCVGIIFTYPFVYIAMYSVYCAYLGKPRQIINK
ncbi:beta-carotene 15,15'-monooxygenase [Chryseobacterium aquaticum]|uniref:Beta-carotene 15,15'-monooxygenase n=1 Tax=Chryseobacterium aquaticum TaxID=452084 RepID=A0A848NCB0_9FLAO|nr:MULTISPECIES: beta-carotene 15,15'-monooxygenase [Chryseobacterium]NMR36019.1 beta-carotene 15,15'-monooxygenase [Chryseobacterium aquaticum]NRQ48094.1 beta-carotene 15,15'-monooxygenase [Chryseobacterium sp. C-204]